MNSFLFQVLANTVEEIGLESLSQFPFTHESLLVDRKDKKLSRLEKKIAERSFEAERHSQISYTRPSYAAYYPKGPEAAALGSPFGLPPVLPGLPGSPFPPPPAPNQNNVPLRTESWRAPPSRPINEHENMNFVKPKSHPVYNGMRENDNVPGK